MNLADPAATQILIDLLASGLSAQFVVTGASMRPFLAGGEMVTLQRVHPAELRCGDLVLCRQHGQAGPRLLLHRIIQIHQPPGHPRVVQTQGDACRAPDPPVTEDAVLGRVSAIHPSAPNVSSFRLDGRSRLIQARVIALRQRAGWQVHQIRITLCMRRRCVRVLAQLPGFPQRQSSTVIAQQARPALDKASPVTETRAALPERLLVLCLCARWEPASLDEVRALMSREALDWDEVRPLAAAGGVAPLLYAVLAGRELAPPALEAWLQQAFAACYARSMFMLMQLEEILRCFNNAGIPVLLLKGAALIMTVYRQAGLRPMTDLDLLVRQADVARSIDLLGSLGFSPLHHDPRSGTAFAYENEVMLRGPHPSGVLVELHWSLFDSPHHQVNIDMAWFWQTAQPVKVGEADAGVLCPEALLLHLCGHLALHHRGETKLLWKHDIAEVIAHYGAAIDWITVIERAQQYDLVTPLQEILPDCAQEWGVAIPADVVSALCRLEPSARERRALTRLTAAHSSVAGRFWTDVAALPGWRTRAGYVWENLFPSVTFMRWRYKIGAPYLLLLYYPYRWLLALRSALGLPGRGEPLAHVRGSD